MYLLLHVYFCNNIMLPWLHRVGVVQWVERLTTDQSDEFEHHTRLPLFSLSKKRYPRWLAMAGFGNGFERKSHEHKWLVSKSN